MSTRITQPAATLMKALLALTAGALLGACASSPSQELPEVDSFGLHRADSSNVQAVYLDPEADFSQFHRVAIAPVEVAFRKNWLRDQNRDRTRRVSQADADQIKLAVADEFKRVLTEELTSAGYAVVDLEGLDNSADDLLLLRPAILNLDVTAPDVQQAGRSRSFTASAGSMTLYLELNDALSGALLGRVLDSRAAPDRGFMSISNSVTNRSEATRIMRRWAQLLAQGLDRAHGKS